MIELQAVELTEMCRDGFLNRMDDGLLMATIGMTLVLTSSRKNLVSQEHGAPDLKAKAYVCYAVL